MTIGYKNIFIIGCALLLAWAFDALYANIQGIFVVILFFVFSMLCLVKAADLFVLVALEIGRRLNINQLGTGVLIIAIGTSAPELFAPCLRCSCRSSIVTGKRSSIGVRW